ncbi:hypothetical protein [Allomuricauda sp. SCSIO 65647]|uniref:hypothetical protein n=1 Tax=Allomuricauda sp. SCSIO 65647 TaxID=2908843 RepID=UPI001F15D3E2|nr:hypothetical protein [Muricauda sp. SCSIO 65647]UJH68555.1 hypothetical protein L0P89_04925 [Muricauda sp. SCSIO 65647]
MILRRPILVFKTFFFCLFSFHTSQVQAQDDEVLRYSAPTNDFIDLVIQSHKGLPRYGDLYYRRGVTTPTTNKAYIALVELKFMKAILDDMNRSKLDMYSNPNEQAAINSSVAQRHLLTLAGFICSDDVLMEHFCDPDSRTVKQPMSSRQNSCQFNNAAGERKFLGHWGGSRNNEFRQLRSYKYFLENLFPSLQSWADSFYEEGKQTAYYVTQTRIVGKYDFKSKGYWIAPKGSGIGSMPPHAQFLAYTEGEKILKGNDHKKILLPMAPDKAKSLGLQDRMAVFLVNKVNMLPTLVAQGKPRIQFEYELEGDVLEVYKDVQLTEKIGELNSNKLVSKY